MVAMLLREAPLRGGDVTDGVVRVGDTVRRPRSPSAPAVHALLRHLRKAGFEGAPRVLGVDEHGREVLTYVEGTTGLSRAAVSDEALADLGALLRRFHDATAGFPLTRNGWEGGSNDDAPAEVIGHCDLTPDNVVFRRGRPYALIDFDLARPTTRLFDIVTTIRHWAPIADPVDRDPLQRPLDAGARLRVFCDAYGATAGQRRRLIGLARLRFGQSYELMRARAGEGGGWGRMWAEGAGERIRRAAAWLDTHEDELYAHLV
ncbi:phosphotransferase [Nonomuraea sp. NPDC046570]|uniref:phosphotransferase n=1 Tax=Nonomuraea sp. NPDC046570 TaxID=3155255 RepID=UPI0033C16945